MKTTYVYFTGLLLSLLFGCLDDKGNYDYLKGDDIKLRIGDQFVNAGDSLEVDPYLIEGGKNYLKKKEFHVEWQIGKEIVSGDSILKINQVTLPLGSHDALCVVTSRATGLQYMKTFSIEVGSKYASGWLILYEKNNQPLLAYTKGRSEWLDVDGEYKEVLTWDTDDSLYYKMNGTYLPPRCKKLADHGYKPGNYQAGGVTIVQAGPDGGIELNGYTLQKDYTVRELFLEETLPAGFELKDILYTGSGIHALGEDGRLYSSRFVDKVFWSVRLSHVQANHEGKALNIDHFIPTEYYLSSYVWLMYSRQERRFLSVFDDDMDIPSSIPDDGWVNDPAFWKSGKIMKNTLPADFVLKDPYKDFDKLDDTRMDVVASGYCNTYDHNADYLLILKNDHGDYFLQKHHDELDRYLPASLVQPRYHKAAPFLKGLVKHDSQFVINALYSEDILFSSDGVIYIFDSSYETYTGGELLVMDATYAGKTITSMELNNEGSRLGVGFSDGTVIIYEKPSVNDIRDEKYTPKELFKARKFGDRVVDIIFKNAAPVQGAYSENES